MRHVFTLSSNAILLPVLMAIGCGSEASVDSAGDDSGNTTVGSAPEAPGAAPAAPSAPAAPGPGGAPGDPRAAAPGDPMAAAPGDPVHVGPIPGPGGANPADPNAANQPGSTKSALPENVAEWSPDNFRSAARQRDRRLKPAIESLVGRTSGDPKTAELLEELLTLVGQSNTNGGPGGEANPGGIPMPGAAGAAPALAPAAFVAQAEPAAPAAAGVPGGPVAPMPERPMPAGPMPGAIPGAGGHGGGDVRGLVHAIIDGLARNNSDRAWQTLNGVLSGRIKTAVDDRGVTDWILAAALDNYGGSGHATHKLLEAAVKDPNSLNSSRSKELGRQAVALVAGTAASVMDHLMGIPVAAATTGQSQRGHQPEGGAFPGAQPMPQAAAAAGGTPGGFQGAGDFGNGALPPPRFNLQPRSLTDDGVRKAVQYLWNAESLGRLEGDVRNIQSLSNGIDTLTLAGSLPTPGIRKATSDLLQGQWKEGATPLLLSGLYQSAARDPGLIVVLKQLPRIMPTGAQTNQQNPNVNPQASKSQRESMAKQTWMGASAQMVLNVIGRLSSRPQGSDNGSVPELPFRLQRDAKVMASHEVNWLDSGSEAIPGVSPPGPLKLQYVKTDVSQNAAQAFQFYKKQLKRGKDYKFPQGAWIDSLTMGTKQGTRRSVDVLIKQGSRSGQNGPGGPQQPGGAAPGIGQPPVAGDIRAANPGVPGGGQAGNAPQFTLEILVVEIPDPKLPLSD